MEIPWNADWFVEDHSCLRGLFSVCVGDDFNCFNVCYIFETHRWIGYDIMRMLSVLAESGFTKNEQDSLC